MPREQLGSAETGLDALLRCLEVLSTSELSSIGPTPPRRPFPITTPTSQDFPAVAAATPSAAREKIVVVGESAVVPGTGDDTASEPSVTKPLKEVFGTIEAGAGAVAAGTALAGSNRTVLTAEHQQIQQHQQQEREQQEEQEQEQQEELKQEQQEEQEQEQQLQEQQRQGKGIGEGKKGGTSTTLETIVGRTTYGNAAVNGSRDSINSGGSSTKVGIANVASAAGSARGSVLRGLVKSLMPWEHSRRSQRAALLVLGNILGNALQETTGGDVGDFGLSLIHI